MKIYYIAVTSWDGNHAYTFDYIRPFLTKQKRDEALKKMKESPACKRGDLWLYADEDEVEDAPEETVEVRVQTSPLNGPLGISAYCCNFPSNHPFYHCKEGDKVRIIVIKEGE